MPTREIRTILSLDGDQKYYDSVKKINDQQKLLKKELRASVEAYELEGDKKKTLSVQTENLYKQIDLQKQKIAETTHAVEESTEKYGENADTTRELKAELQFAENALAKMQNKLKDVTEQLILSESKLHNLGEKAMEVGKKWETTGEKMSKVGGTLSKTVTLPIAALGTVAAKSAMEFESAFAGVKKTVDATDEELAQLSDGIRNMAKEIPSSAVAISEVAEAAGQLGVETPNILDFTRVMIDLGNSTNLSATDAAEALAKFTNITGMAASDYGRLGSVIVAMGNNFATTEADIVSMSTNLASAGTLAGLSETQILALATAMSSVGIEAEAGGTAMTQTLTAIEKSVASGGKSLQQFADVAGMTSQEFSETWKNDPMTAIQAFIGGLGGLEEKGESATLVLDEMGLSGVRQSNMLKSLALASDNMGEAVRLSSQAWEENNALTKEAEQRYSTTESQMEIAKNNINDAAITIGQHLLPVIADVAKWIADVAQAFGNLNPETQKTILLVAGLVAALGPVLKIGGNIVKVGGKVMQLFGKLTTAFTKNSAAAKAANTVMEKTGGVVSDVGKSAQSATRGTDALSSGMKNTGSAAGTAGGALSGFGSALAGLGIAAAITLVSGLIASIIEYANATNSAKIAADNLAESQKAQAQAMSEAHAKIDEENRAIAEKYQSLEGEIAEITAKIRKGLIPSEEGTRQLTEAYGRLLQEVQNTIDQKTTEITTTVQGLFSESALLTGEDQQRILGQIAATSAEHKQQAIELNNSLLEEQKRAIGMQGVELEKSLEKQSGIRKQIYDLTLQDFNSYGTEMTAVQSRIGSEQVELNSKQREEWLADIETAYTNGSDEVYNYYAKEKAAIQNSTLLNDEAKETLIKIAETTEREKIRLLLQEKQEAEKILKDRFEDESIKYEENRQAILNGERDKSETIIALLDGSLKAINPFASELSIIGAEYEATGIIINKTAREIAIEYKRFGKEIPEETAAIIRDALTSGQLSARDGMTEIVQSMTNPVLELPPLMSGMTQESVDAMITELQNGGVLTDAEAQNLRNTITSQIGQLPDDFQQDTQEAMDSLRDTMVNNLGISEDTATQVLTALTTPIDQVPEKYRKNANSAINYMLSELVRNGTITQQQANAIASLMMSGFADGIEGQKENVSTEAENVNTAVKDELRNLPEDMKTTGTNSATGFWKGFASKLKEVADTARAYSNTAQNAYKKADDQRSPSKKWNKLGTNSVMGLYNAFVDNAGIVEDAARKMAEQSMEGAQDAFEHFDVMLPAVDFAAQLSSAYQRIQSARQHAGGAAGGNTTNTQHINVEVHFQYTGEMKSEADVRRIAQLLQRQIDREFQAKGVARQ